MATLKQNSTYRNGNRVFGNYRLVVALPSGHQNITLPNTQFDKQAALDYQLIANAVEAKARLKPNQPQQVVYQNKSYRDWKVYLYNELGLIESFIKPEKKKAEPTYTFEMAFDEMIKYKKNTKHLRPRAIENILQTQNVFIQILGKDIPIKRFDLRMYSTLLDKMSKLRTSRGKIGYSDTTKNIHMRNLRSLLNWCVKTGHIDRVCFTTDDIPQPDTSCQDKTYISKESFELICQLASNPIYASYWKVAYATGLRLRELANSPDLKHYNGLWHSIARKDNHWVITVEVGKNKKKQKAITILPDEYYEDYKIMTSNYCRPETISKSFSRASKLAGFNFTFRNTRNSFAGNLLDSGYSPFVVSKLLRHSNLAITDKYLKDIDFQWTTIKKELN